MKIIMNTNFAFFSYSINISITVAGGKYYTQNYKLMLVAVYTIVYIDIRVEHLKKK